MGGGWKGLWKVDGKAYGKWMESQLKVDGNLATRKAYGKWMEIVWKVDGSATWKAYGK
jgi:hypothetical protein